MSLRTFKNDFPAKQFRRDEKLIMLSQKESSEASTTLDTGLETSHLSSLLHHVVRDSKHFMKVIPVLRATPIKKGKMGAWKEGVD